MPARRRRGSAPKRPLSRSSAFAPRASAQRSVRTFWRGSRLYPDERKGLLPAPAPNRVAALHQELDAAEPPVDEAAEERGEGIHRVPKRLVAKKGMHASVAGQVPW